MGKYESLEKKDWRTEDTYCKAERIIGYMIFLGFSIYFIFVIVTFFIW